MNTNICKILVVVAILIMNGGCATGKFATSEEEKPQPRTNPKSCTACHNGNHAIDLAKFTPEEIAQKLDAFANGGQGGYVMPKISREMSKESKDAVSEALGSKKTGQ